VFVLGRYRIHFSIPGNAFICADGDLTKHQAA
jgi:hypothetical protein